VTGIVLVPHVRVLFAEETVIQPAPLLLPSSLRQLRLWVIKFPNLQNLWAAPDLVFLDPQIIGFGSPNQPKANIFPSEPYCRAYCRNLVGTENIHGVVDLRIQLLIAGAIFLRRLEATKQDHVNHLKDT
jgi:hypothetical protein